MTSEEIVNVIAKQLNQISSIGSNVLAGRPIIRQNIMTIDVTFEPSQEEGQEPIEAMINSLLNVSRALVCFPIRKKGNNQWSILVLDKGEACRVRDRLSEKVSPRNTSIIAETHREILGFLLLDYLFGLRLFGPKFKDNPETFLMTISDFAENSLSISGQFYWSCQLEKGSYPCFTSDIAKSKWMVTELSKFLNHAETSEMASKVILETYQRL